MLREQVAKVLPTTNLCEICYLHKPGTYTRKDCVTYGKRLCAYEEMIVGEILNLFKAEVDKLTVIDDGEIIRALRGTHTTVKPKVILIGDRAIALRQLQHTKKQLLDLMGE